MSASAATSSSKDTATTPTPSKASQDDPVHLDLPWHGVNFTQLSLEQLLGVGPVLYQGWYSTVRDAGRYAIKTSNDACEMLAGYTMAVAARDCAVRHLALVQVGTGTWGVAMERGAPVTVESAGMDKPSIARRFVEVVRRLHGVGIVHGDIKLSNFLVCSSDGLIRLTDFVEAHYNDNLEPPGKTSVAWCSPRHIAGDEAPWTAADDIYSLAMTIWELFAGRMPYTTAAEDPSNLDPEDIRNLIRGGAELDMAEIYDQDTQDMVQQLMLEGRGR